MVLKEWLEKAQAENFAIGAFNVDNLEIFKAVCLGAKNKRSPVILQFSPGEVGYFGLSNIVDLVKNARVEFGIPIFLNLDHSEKAEDCISAIETGEFAMVNFDGSGLEIAENIKHTKKIVEVAHKKDGLVEGEINKLLGTSEVHSEGLDLDTVGQSLTDPADALRFVTETGVDIFAPVFGNVHGIFANQPNLNVDLLSKVKAVLPTSLLSIHGASGVPADQLRTAIQTGKIVKVNVNTELRQVYRDSIIQKEENENVEFKYYNVAPEVVLAICAVVEGKIDVFGSARRI